MSPRNTKSLERRVVEAAEAALATQQVVTAIDVLVGLGWLPPARVEEWRQGRVSHLERAAQANLAKISAAMKLLRTWAIRRGLVPHETASSRSYWLISQFKGKEGQM